MFHWPCWARVGSHWDRAKAPARVAQAQANGRRLWFMGRAPSEGVDADAMNAIIGLTSDVMVSIGTEEVEIIGMGAKTSGFKCVHTGEITIADDLLSGFGIGEFQIGTALFVMAWHGRVSSLCLYSNTSDGKSQAIF